MKTIEEKARAYGEALERANNELKACSTFDCDATRQIFRLFPELKEENEDKRIKKEICKLLWDYVPHEEAQKYINYICRKQPSTNIEEHEEIKETCIFYLNKLKCYVSDVSCVEKCIAWIEKQGE